MRKIFASIFQNKRNLLLLVGVGLILSLIPIHPAHAFIKELQDIFDAIMNLPINLALAMALFVVMVVFNLFSGLLASAFALVVALTKWLIDTSINIGVIANGANTPQVVTDGWNFTLGFVNMLFILILAFYALATILRIKEYDLRKHLPKVLMIAVLVNFTPVIVGLIVDAGNITTSFFMEKALDTDIVGIVLGDEGAGTGIWGAVVKPAIDRALSAILSNILGDPSETIGLFIEAVGPLLMAIIFLVMACLIFLMVSFVFLMRIIMLWVLMILAPIAFFSYVIPGNAPLTILFPDILLWRKWWEEFLRWVIVGIPFGLFIYIAAAMVQGWQTILTSGASYAPSGLTFTIGGISLDIDRLFTALQTIVPFVLPLAVLYVGYKIAMKAAPAGAQGIIKGVTGAAKTGAMMVATGGAAAVGATVGGVGGAMAGRAATTVSGVSSRLQGAEAWVGRRRGGGVFKQVLKPATLAARGVEKALVPRLRKAEAEMKKVEKVKGIGDMKPSAQLTTSQSQLTAQGRITNLAAMKPSDLAKELEKDEKAKGRVIRDVQNLAGNEDYEEQVKKVAKVLPEGVNEEVALKFGIKKEDIDKATENLKEQLEDNKDLKIEIRTSYGLKKNEDISEKIKRDVAATSVHASRLSSKDVSELSSASLKSLPVRLGSKHWTGSHLAKVADFDASTMKDFFEKPGGINTLGAKDLYRANPRLARYFATNPAGREWGLEGFNRDDEGKINLKEFENEIINEDAIEIRKGWKKVAREGPAEKRKKHRKIFSQEVRSLGRTGMALSPEEEENLSRRLAREQLRRGSEPLPTEEKPMTRIGRAKKAIKRRSKRIFTEEGLPGAAASPGEETSEKSPLGTAESTGGESPEESPPGTA